ncbi:MAG: hypothetical protein R3293_26965, partial [Candidatus Promineifilaceae bacterium]|nr:hypothetical protein [Candidatus Promineifilaceae bacterium]
MPDFKYWAERRSLQYLKARDYPTAARAALREMHRQVGDLRFDERGLALRGLLVRHLVMPGGEEDTAAIMRFLAEELSPHTFVNVMGQYYPAGKVSAAKYAAINRRPSPAEYTAAFAAAREAGLYRFDQRR